MGFRFRRSLRIFPGLRLNLSKTGVSASVGVQGATINLGRKGIRGTVGVPGSGMSYSKLLLRSGRNTGFPAPSTIELPSSPERVDELVTPQTNEEAFEDTVAAIYLLTAHLVVGSGKPSASWLQRQLSISYEDAAHLIEQLESDGIVSPADKLGRRKVLVDVQSLPELPS